MINLEILILIIWLHFFADFVLQTHEMSINKSKSNWWLGYHLSVYTIPFIVVFGLLHGVAGLTYALINGVLHFCTDWGTSRINSHFWEKNDLHWFFTNIGADQAIHLTTLVVTYVLLFG